MNKKTWLRRKPTRLASARFRPGVDPLEDRLAPAALNTFLTSEHVDIDLGYDAGANEWTVQHRDADNAVSHDVDDALLYAGAPSLTSRPAGGQFDFIGVGAGEDFYQLPQSQDYDLLYLGFSAYQVESSDIDRYDAMAESGGRVDGEGRWLKVSLAGVEHTTPSGGAGNGKFSVWQTEIGEPPNVFMATSNGIDSNDALWITAGGHIHYNWGFTEPGRYEVRLKLSGYLNDDNTTSLGQYVESEPFTVYFSVTSVGQLQFDSATTAVNEQAGYRTLLVNRIGGSDGEIKVNYATSDGSGTVSDGDYVASSGSLVFKDGETQKAITVQVANAGSVGEANDTFDLALSVPASVVPGDTGGLNEHLVFTTGTELLGPIATTTLTINETPAFFAPADQTTTIGTPTSPIAFTISDAETSAADLVVTAFSTNSTVLPNSGIVLGGSEANRTVTLTPAAGQSGSAQVTLLVTDASGATRARSFYLRVGYASASTPLAITTSTPANSVPNVVIAADDTFTLSYTTTATTWTTTVSFVELDNSNLINQHGTGSTHDLRTQPGVSGATARTLRVRGNDNSTEAGEYGRAAVTLAFTGSGAPSNTHSFNLRVNPRAVVDNQLLAIPGAVNTFDVLANDCVPHAGHVFTITGVSTPANGTLTISSDGKYVRYVPTNPGAYFDTFTYTVTVSSTDDFNGYTFTGVGNVKIGGYVVVDSATASQHTDIDIDFVDGAWTQNIRTDASIDGAIQSGTFGQTVVDADEGIIFLDPSTKQARNAGTLFDSLGVPQGADVWRGPETSNGNKIYLGIANEATNETTVDAYVPVGDPRATSNSHWVRTDLVGYSGPGNFAAFYSGFVVFDTYDGLNSANETALGDNPTDTFWGFAGSHSHMAWYFTAPGRYELTFRSTVRVGGTFVISPETTFTFDVDTIGGDVRLTENPPLARSDSATVAEDSGATTIDVMANDTSSADPYEALTVTAVTQGSQGGAISIGVGGANVAYAPPPNFSGSETFSYTVTDEHGGSATTTVTVTVTPHPDNPVAAADSFSVSPGNSVRGNVLFNDTDPDGNPLTAVLDAGPAHGTLDLNPDGSFTYTPGVNFSGSDSFTYVAFDGALSSSAATVTISAATSPTFAAIIAEGHTDIGIAFEEDAWDLHVHDEVHDEEYEPDEALISVGTPALTTRLAGSEYDFIGVGAGSSFYQIPDSATAGVPFLGFGLEEIEEGVFDGDTVTLSLVSVNGPGQFSVWRSGGAEIAFATSDGITAADSKSFPTGDHEHYNFAFTAPGRYEVTVRATGTLAGETEPTTSDPVTYYFNVGHNPLAAADSFTVSPGNSVRGNVLFNDTDLDADPLTAVLDVGPTLGTLDLNSDGSFTYTPGVTFSGSDSFTYVAFDGALSSTPTTVTISAASAPSFVEQIAHDHIDIGIAYEEGEWDLHVHDEENDVEYEPAEVSFVVGAPAEAPRPAGSEYDFLGVAAGASVWTLPESENPALPFLGVATEEIVDGTFDGDAISFELVAVDGPGHVSLWTDGVNPTVLFATADGITSADATSLATGEHAHFNWSFTAAGRYAITVQARGNVAGIGPSVSEPATYYFDVYAAPAVTSVAPFVGPTAGGNIVVIVGTNFTGATHVNFKDHVVTEPNFTVNSATQITVIVPSNLGSAEVVDVTVTTPGATSSTVGTADDYSYAKPTVTSVVPGGLAVQSLSGATWSSGDPLVTVASTAGLAVGAQVSSSGTGFPARATILSIDGPTTFTLSAAPTGTQATASIVRFVNAPTKSGTVLHLTSATWTTGSAVVTVASTTNLIAGQFVGSAAPGLPADAVVASVTNGTTFVLNSPATADASGATIDVAYAAIARDQYGNLVDLSGPYAGSVVQHLLVSFSEKVTLDSDAFTLVNLSGSITTNSVTPATGNVAIVAAGIPGTGDDETGFTQYVLNFVAGNATNSFSNSSTLGNAFSTLKDSLFRLDVDGSKVHNAAAELGNNHSQNLWSLYGVVNTGDVFITGTPGGGDDQVKVDGLALSDVYATFGSSANATTPPYNRSFDGDLDGDVDGIDLSRLYGNFGTIWNF